MQCLYHMNTSCLMKPGWEIKQDEPHLWCDVLGGKYMGRLDPRDGVVAKGCDSSLWKAIVQCWPRFDEFVYRSIGNGMSTPAWANDWIGMGASIANLNIPIHEELRNYKVVDLVTS